MPPERRDEVRDLALTLENDQRFCAAYKQIDGSAKNFRDLICDHAKHLDKRIFEAEDREQIRRYLHRVWCMPKPLGTNNLGSRPTIDLFDDGRVTANDIKNPEPQLVTQEPPMNATPIEITTKTFVNGQDIKAMSDAQVYELIASEEAKIKELEKIETKPKKLVAEIERRRAGIKDLVTYLDSKTD